MRHALALSLSIVVLGLPAAAAAQTTAEPARATIVERPKHVSFGVITVDAPPAEVYALVTTYAEWKTVFRDVFSLRVLGGGRDDAVMELKTRSLGNLATVQFENVPDQAIRFRLIDGPPGARARGEYKLIPVDGGTRTRIEATLYMDVVGAPGLFVTDRKTRTMRQAKLRADLEDVATWFARRPQTAQPT